MHLNDLTFFSYFLMFDAPLVEVCQQCHILTHCCLGQARTLNRFYYDCFDYVELCYRKSDATIGFSILGFYIAL